MWIKKDNVMFNIGNFDAIMHDTLKPGLIVLVAGTKRLGIGKYDAEQASTIIDEIAKAMINGDSLYVMPCEKN